MKLALIPPFDRLSDINHTNYQLALAHILAAPSRWGVEYAGHYIDAKARGDFVILDNGAYEGALVGAGVLINIANQLEPNELVIPDSLKNAEMTKQMALSFHNYHQEQLYDDINLMYVIQGETYMEFGESAEWAMKQDWINTIAIPKHMIVTCESKTARLDLASWFRDWSGKDIHLLGASPLWTDEIRAARDQGIVRGMDTSMPYVYGYSYEGWPSDQIIDSSESRSFYFDIEGDSEQNDIVTTNVKGMIDCVNEL